MSMMTTAPAPVQIDDATDHAPDAYAPTTEDWQAIREWDLARADRLPDQSDELVPVEVLSEATDYDAWPEWAQTERWGLPDEPEAFALPVGVSRASSTRVDPDEDRRACGLGY